MKPEVLPLDAWAQDPEFVAVASVMEGRDPRATRRIVESVYALGRRGPFTAEDVMDTIGRDSMPTNQIGAVIGNLASRRVIKMVGDIRARHQGAKGRRILRWELVGPAWSDPSVCALPHEAAHRGRLPLMLPPVPEVPA